MRSSSNCSSPRRPQQRCSASTSLSVTRSGPRRRSGWPDRRGRRRGNCSWSRILDDDRNVNNRFEVAAALNHRLADARSPFWGCPPSAASEHLRPSKPASSGSLAEYRGVEQILRGQGYRPFSSWQLLGAGAVGSQSLLGIARLERLRRRFPDRVEVWPFTTSLGAPTLDRGAIVIAEVWPSMLRDRRARATPCVTLPKSALL